VIEDAGVLGMLFREEEVSSIDIDERLRLYPKLRDSRGVTINYMYQQPKYNMSKMLGENDRPANMEGDLVV
jgi:hypothetical protein